MKRRTLLKGLAAGIALSLSPVFLNRARLELVHEQEPEYIITVNAYLNGKLVAIGQNRVVDNGVDMLAETSAPGVTMVTPYRGVPERARRFRFPAGQVVGSIDEVSVDMPGVERQRTVFDQPITVMADEELDVVYEYRRA